MRKKESDRGGSRLYIKYFEKKEKKKIKIYYYGLRLEELWEKEQKKYRGQKVLRIVIWEVGSSLYFIMIGFCLENKIGFE